MNRRKHMIRWWRIGLAALIVASAMFLCAGCSKKAKKAEQTKATQEQEQMLNKANEYLQQKQGGGQTK